MRKISMLDSTSQFQCNLFDMFQLRIEQKARGHGKLSNICAYLRVDDSNCPLPHHHVSVAPSCHGRHSLHTIMTNIYTQGVLGCNKVATIHGDNRCEYQPDGVFMIAWDIRTKNF